MPDSPRYIYWDANCFTYYINESSEHIDTLQGILSEVEKSNGELKIVTSTLSISEVAFTEQERRNQALGDTELDRSDRIFQDYNVVLLVDLNQLIAQQARQVMRVGLENNLKKDPRDCIHLATAKFMRAIEVQTYERSLWGFSNFLGITVCQPHVQQPGLL